MPAEGDTEVDAVYVDSAYDDEDESKAATTSTCRAGQSCTGCFSGVLLAYLGLILFNKSIVVIFMLVCMLLMYFILMYCLSSSIFFLLFGWQSIGVSFGLLGSAVENPNHIKLSHFLTYIIITVTLSGLMSYLYDWTGDLTAIAGVSFLTASVLSSLELLLQITNVEKLAAVNPEIYKSCQV